MVASIFASQQPAFAGFGPININPPVVSGGGLVGEQLTSSTGLWNAEPDPTFTYQWKRNGIDITGETANTYTNVQADVGQNISCTVTATNADGTASANSNSVQIGGAPVNTAEPVVTGTTVVGQTLSTTDGTWVAFPAPTFTYQWLRSTQPISGANANTYVLVNDDENSAMQCRVTATNFFGNNSEVSNAIGPVTQPLSAPTNTTAPLLSGNAVVDQQVDCGPGIWTGNPTPTFTYQWKKDGVNIDGATDSTYTCVSEDVGGMISLTVTATNSQGSSSADSSNIMGPVTA